MKENTILVGIISGAFCLVLGFAGGALLTRSTREKTGYKIAAIKAESEAALQAEQEKTLSAIRQRQKAETETAQLKKRLSSLKSRSERLTTELKQTEASTNNKSNASNFEQQSDHPEFNQTESRVIDISYEQVMEYLSNFFIMEKSTPVRGQDRYMGHTVDNLAVLEVIGNKKNISVSTIMLGIPSDAPDKLVRNIILANHFLTNTVPEWVNSNEWITANAERFANIPGASDMKAVKVKGNKLITMTFLKPLGMIVLTVKHK